MNPELMSGFEFSCRLAIGSTFILGVGLLTMLACRKQSSSARHLVGTLTLIAISPEGTRTSDRRVNNESQTK